MRNGIIDDCVDAFIALERSKLNVERAEQTLHRRMATAMFEPDEMAEYVKRTEDYRLRQQAKVTGGD